jgi:hypothetical protein
LALLAQGKVHMVEKIIDRGIKSLSANSVVISRDAWLKARCAISLPPVVHVFPHEFHLYREEKSALSQGSM